MSLKDFGGAVGGFVTAAVFHPIGNIQKRQVDFYDFF